MSKQHLQTKVPSNLEEEVKEFRDEHGIDHDSEACRQLLERGINDWRGTSYADIAIRRAFEIAWIASFFSITIGWSLQVSGLLQAGGAFAATCVVFAALWLTMNGDRVRTVIADG